MRNEAIIHVEFPGLDDQIKKLERVTALLREIKELRDELLPRHEDPPGWEVESIRPDRPDGD